MQVLRMCAALLCLATTRALLRSSSFGRRLGLQPVRLLRQGSRTGGGGLGRIRVTGSSAGSRTASWFTDLFMGRKIEDEDVGGGATEVDPGNVKGTKLKILKYPNPKLRSENAQVTVFDDSLRQKASEMLLVMYAADGIGLAAPQVGINERLMVFNEVGDRNKPDKVWIRTREKNTAPMIYPHDSAPFIHIPRIPAKGSVLPHTTALPNTLTYTFKLSRQKNQKSLSIWLIAPRLKRCSDLIIATLLERKLSFLS